MGMDLYNDTYDSFYKSIKKVNASILEIGCGPGNITRYITSRNPLFKITAIDFSENMIELARKNVPNADFYVMDCRKISDFKNRFDAIVCGFTIPYLSPIDCSMLLSDCSNLLERDGMLYLSFVNGNPKSSGYMYGTSGDRLYFYFHDYQLIKQELERNNLVIINVMEKEYQKSDDTIEVHTILFAKKSSRLK